MSEQSIIDAFGRVLGRDGVAGLGVNAVLREAGAGKKQLYDYFGGLEGLALRWCNEVAMARAREAAREAESAPGEGGPFQRMVLGMARYASRLREDPAGCQLLAAELAGPSPLARALEAMRAREGREHAKWARSGSQVGLDLEAATLLLTAAANYLALRAVRAPGYHGLNLESEDGWSRIVESFLRVGELLEQRGGSRSIATASSRGRPARARKSSPNR